MEKKYLKWYQKIGYGSGDIAGNVVYALLTAFVMFYLTDTVGLSMGIIGTLIALSKVFDGVTDFFFGRMIDKTHKNGQSSSLDVMAVYRLFGCSCSLLCNPYKLGTDSTVCFLLHCIHTTQCSILYSKQHCLCFSYSPYNKEYKRKSAAWFNPFHLRIRNKYVDSVHNY